MQSASTKDICSSFGWFDNRLKSAVLEATKTFFETKYEVKTQSVTTNQTVKSDFASKGEIYFTAQLPICAHQNSFIRISSEFIRVVFHDCFGSNSPIFKLQDLSELEIKILNTFCEFLNEEMKAFIIPHDKIPKENIKNKDLYNVTFLMGKENASLGKIVVTLPQNCLNVEKVKLENSFSDMNFITVPTFVNISAGTSKLSLNDLKNLRTGDIILLENSSTDTMHIKTDTITKSFKVNPDPSLTLELDDIEGQELGVEMADNQNIWDNIQVEVGAEFDKIKMTLGDLKQISKGLVIDLGPIFENKISLIVENKVVAKGELVIINDKYGVKIDEILSSKEEEQTEAPAPQQKQAPQPKPAPQPMPKKAPPQTPPKKPASKQAPPQAAAGDKEEFDYSDFENEDS